MLRARTIEKYYSGLENVIEVMLTYPEVNYRYMMEPTGPYPKAINLLNFNNKNTWPMQENGREDSQTCLDYGYGYGFDTLNLAIAENSHKLIEYNGDVRAFATYLAE